MSVPVFLKSLRLRNFRSVRSADLSFDNPLFLVGRNGSGKSNVVDAIAFLADCVNLTLKAAVEKRGLLSHIVYSEMNEWNFIELRADVDFGSNANNSKGFYVLRLKIEGGDYAIDAEECFVERNEKTHYFRRRGSNFETSVSGLKPRLGSQSLALPLVGGIEEFAVLADGFAAMRVYHIDHRKIRSAEGAEASPVLSANGENVAGVLQQLTRQGSNRNLFLVDDVLRPITPVETSFNPIERKDGTFVLLGSEKRWDASFGGTKTNIYDRYVFSDGTLHALGVAVALLQNPPPSVLVIEEPENNLHPGALAAISDLIEEASRKTQVIITTHSPDLLDAKWITPENLRVVTWENDASRVSNLAERPQKALREHLMYAGQLMRANALEAAPAETGEAITDNPVAVLP